MDEQIRKKFLGSLLGVAVGDAIGASYEGHRMVADHEIELIAEVSHRLHYTDDMHMTIGVAESLTNVVVLTEPIYQNLLTNCGRLPQSDRGSR